MKSMNDNSELEIECVCVCVCVFVCVWSGVLAVKYVALVDKRESQLTTEMSFLL